MLELFVAALTVFQASYVFDVVALEQPKDRVYLMRNQPREPETLPPRHVKVEPLSKSQYKNVVKQRYDYSCGSAAVSTLLKYYLGERDLTELQAMRGMLNYGERQKIIQRQAFSLLDMKKYVTSLGYKSGGFKAELSDLKGLDRPVIVPIKYGGFEHFVVLKTITGQRAFIADPARSVGGNITLTVSYFEKLWDPNVLFMVYKGDKIALNDLRLEDGDLRYLTLQEDYLDVDVRRALQRQRFLENSALRALENRRFLPQF